MRLDGLFFVQRMATQHETPEPIYEFGSLQVQTQNEMTDMRPMFPGKKYVGCDFRPGPGVDVIMDVEKTTLADNSIGTVLIIDTLEHVKNVYAAMDEIYRILKPGGIVIMTSVMLFPIHNFPNDYWRFTPKAFELLLKKFKENHVWYHGPDAFPTGIYGYGVK